MTTSPRAQKQAARARRLEAERASAARAQRTRRMRSLAGVIAGAAVIVVVVVLVTGNHSKKAVTDPDTSAARSIAATVDRLLRGIPEHGATLGNPHAPVTITEYGDLECPYCAQFAADSQAQLIAHDVRAGEVKLTYKSFETATGGGPNANLWPLQQAAAYAAGSQDRAWYYIELFYREQGAEDSGYATTSFQQSVARQIPGLSYARWNADRFAPALARQVLDDGDQARNLGIDATPTIIATGPRSQTRPLSSAAITYTELRAMIRSVVR
jgi:protein-disulfide isomerase